MKNHGVEGSPFIQGGFYNWASPDNVSRLPPLVPEVWFPLVYYPSLSGRQNSLQLWRKKCKVIINIYHATMKLNISERWPRTPRFPHRPLALWCLVRSWSASFVLAGTALRAGNETSGAILIISGSQVRSKNRLYINLILHSWVSYCLLPLSCWTVAEQEL